MWDATEDFGNDKEIIYKFGQSCVVQYGDIWLGLNTDEGEMLGRVFYSVILVRQVFEIHFRHL
jgi:hypothetical protein